MKDRRKKIPDEVMWDLIGRGLTSAEIVRTLKSEFSIEVTAAAITKWKSTHGQPVRHFDPIRKSLIPWRVLDKHTSHRIYRALVADVKLQSMLLKDPNWSLPLAEEQRRDKLVVHLEAHDAVVHYDQTNGWAIVPRRSGIDEGFIRDPRIADDGTPIEDPARWQ